MKTMMNFTTSPDDVERYESPDDLRSFYRQFGCAGLELMPIDDNSEKLICPDMVIGIHACCISDWMELGHEDLVRHYRKNLDYAHHTGAEYVVFHITQVSEEECLTHHPKHNDEEVVLAAAGLINELMDGQPYSFYFLMENLWWPGLTFLNERITRLLLDSVNYKKKGLMLDTGHFLHTNPELRTQAEALDYLHGMLDRHADLIPWIRGLHLQQSLTGAYIKEWLKETHIPDPDPGRRMCQVFEHIFRMDQHLPFTVPGVKELVQKVDPEYVTYEYISRNREEHAAYLKAGSKALMD